MKTFSIIIVAILLISGLTTFPSMAQNNNKGKAEVDISQDGRGWVFGLNFGVYYPSKKTASYYDGQASNENNVNFIMSNTYRYDQIFKALLAYDTVIVAGLPSNMHYQPALQPGLYAQFSFNPELALMIEFNYMRLKANDNIGLEVDPKPYATLQDIRLFPLRGVEERVYGDIGLKRTFQYAEKRAWFINAGLNVNSTKVKKCSFYITDPATQQEVEYDMVNRYGNTTYVPNSNLQTYNVYQGGIGFGMFLGGGASMKFANGMMCEPGLIAHWLTVQLTGYKGMNPGIGAYVRFLF